MKVKIMQRSVYHKIAEIEVEVPKDVDAQEWIVNNEDKWVDDMQTALDNAEIEFGNGMDYGEWTDRNEESEWRYECPDGFGGHL